MPNPLTDDSRWTLTGKRDLNFHIDIPEATMLYVICQWWLYTVHELHGAPTEQDYYA